MPNTSTIIAALPAADDPIQSIGPEKKHATLLWFGEIGESDAAVIKRAVEDVLGWAMPFDQDTGQVEGLGDDEPQAQVLKMVHDGPDLEYTLESLRETLLEKPGVREIWNRQKQWPTFTPHLTLGYGGEVTEDDKLEAKSLGSVRFDRLAVWHKDEQTEYPLAGKLDGMVAGVRFVRTQEGAKRFGVPIGSRIEVDKSGKVVRIDKSAAGAESGRSAKKVERPDPNRQPKKFVATRPGQKAKIPINRVAGGATTSGLSKNQTNAVTNREMINKYGGMDADEAAAVRRLESGSVIGPAGKEALRQMIRRILRRMNQDAAEKTSSSSPKKNDEKPEKQQKEEASTGSKEKKPLSKAQKEAQAKRQAAATAASVFARRLRAAYKALGGDTKDLPAVDGKSGQKTASKSSGTAKSSSAEAPSTAPVDSSGKRLKTSGFVGMNDKELTHSIRSLAMAARTNKSSIVANALRRAKTERRRRAVKDAEHKKRIERLSNPGGAA